MLPTPETVFVKPAASWMNDPGFTLNSPFMFTRAGGGTEVVAVAETDVAVNGAMMSPAAASVAAASTRPTPMVGTNPMLFGCTVSGVVCAVTRVFAPALITRLLIWAPAAATFMNPIATTDSSLVEDAGLERINPVAVVLPNRV